MGDVLLNGREPRDWELLAGVLTGDPPRPGQPRPVTDLVLEFSGPGRRL